MERKRSASGALSTDHECKRVKLEPFVKLEQGYFDFSSIPMAPSAVAAKKEDSKCTSVTVERTVASPSQAEPYRPSAAHHRRRAYRGNSITATRGRDRIVARYSLSDARVEFVIHTRDLNWTWDSLGVEREIFERLQAARFPIEPQHGWGFIDVARCEAQESCHKPSSNTTLATRAPPMNNSFTLVVPVRRDPSILQSRQTDEEAKFRVKEDNWGY